MCQDILWTLSPVRGGFYRFYIAALVLMHFEMSNVISDLIRGWLAVAATLIMVYKKQLIRNIVCFT